MGKFAETTDVPVERTMEDIRAVLKRYQAKSFIAGEIDDRIVVMFEAHGRRIRFSCPLPDLNAPEFRAVAANQFAKKGDPLQTKHEQAVRQRHRALLLTIRAKLESVESGIETFEEAFMPQIVLPDNRTMAEWAVPQIEKAYADGEMPPLLGSGK